MDQINSVSQPSLFSELMKRASAPVKAPAGPRVLRFGIKKLHTNVMQQFKLPKIE